MGYVVDYQDIVFHFLSGKDIFLFSLVLYKQVATSLMHIEGFFPGGGDYSLAKIHIKSQNPWSYIFYFSYTS
jgi:hypothetical protein